ncbi:MAG: serine/threonine protein kinase [Planctomycetota bacterium]|nr:MAG: serine/threonine protein kinase [Planctomycetota bacterium]
MKSVLSCGACLVALAVLAVGCNRPASTSNKEPAGKTAAKEAAKPEGTKPIAAQQPTPGETKPDQTPPSAQPSSEPAAATEEKPAETKPAAEKPAEEKPAEPAPAETPPQPAVESKAADESAEIPAGLPVSAPNDPEPAEHESDYAQWGTSPLKNNVSKATNLPTFWDGGKVDFKTGKRDLASMKNIKWAAALGSQTYANPIVADGRVLIGTNNGNGYLKRYPADVDLGCMLAFTEDKGEFLWQYSSEKLPTGKVHDWELLGICSTPIVEGDRAWFVDNRGEVVCVDTQGFYDDEDDGPIIGEWARLFDIAKSEDPAKDAVAPLVSAFKENKLGDALVEQFAKLEIQLPDGVEIKAGDKPNSWLIDTEVSGVKRSIRMAIEGPRLSVYWRTTPADKHEADVVWKLDMMKELASSQHNAASCSGVIVGDLLFISTSNGVDAQHNNVPAPNAPSLVCLEKETGKVVWTDNSPGVNILHGQWSSPAAAVLGGVPQVIYPNGDGWLRSFRADRGKDGKPELLWKFDCNPKDALYEIRGLGTRNHIIATPVIYKGHVYIAVGEDPEHGDGVGHLWCIDPTKRGDVSPDLAYTRDEMSKPAAERKPIEIGRLDDSRRLQTIDAANGEVAVANPNSAMVWHYASYDVNQDGEIDDFQETMHRSLSTVTIKDEILYTSDFSGIIHCVDAKTGKVYWTHDMLGACWGSCLVADGKVFIGDEDGDVYVFAHGKEKQWLNQHATEETNPTVNMGSSVLGTPIVANNVLYIFNKNTLFAIEARQPDQNAGKPDAETPEAAGQ